MGKVSAATWDLFWRARARPEDFHAASPQLIEHLLPYVTPGCHVLEVGPGTGRDAVALAAAGAHVVALDSSAEALALIQRGLPATSHLTLVRADGLCTPFADGTFDIVYHQGLLEHFRDPLPLLRENHRVLRPGGILLSDVPQTFHTWTVIKKVAIAADRWFAGWETQYTPGELRRVVSTAGLQVIETYGHRMTPGLLRRSLRIGLRSIGVSRPPRQPDTGSPALQVGHRCLHGPLGLHTAFTIGVVARRRL